jgi:hypothetical protein
VALAATHAGEQAAAALVFAAAADRLTADLGGRLAAGGLAAAAAATLEQTGSRFLILAHHGKPDHGHQHGDRPHDDTIHLDLLQVTEQKYNEAHYVDRRVSFVPGPLRRSTRGWVNTHGHEGEGTW